MKRKYSFIDDVALSRQFSTGDVVRKPGGDGKFASPYAGSVLYSNTSTGMVSVQWPWGSEQEWASELIPDTSGDIAPPAINSAYSTWEMERYTTTPKSRKASQIVKAFEDKTYPVYAEASRLHYNGSNEIDAFVGMKKYCDRYGSDVVRRTVSNIFNQKKSGK